MSLNRRTFLSLPFVAAIAGRFWFGKKKLPPLVHQIRQVAMDRKIDGIGLPPSIYRALQDELDSCCAIHIPIRKSSQYFPMTAGDNSRGLIVDGVSVWPREQDYVSFWRNGENIDNRDFEVVT